MIISLLVSLVLVIPILCESSVISISISLLNHSSEFGYTSQWSNGVLNCTRSSTKRDSLAKECPPGEKYYYQSKSG